MNLRVYGMIAVLMLASGLIGGLVSRWSMPVRTADAQANRRVEAGQFAVGLPGGRDRGQFGMGRTEGVGLTMWDSSDRARLLAGVSDDGYTLLSLAPEGSGSRAALSVTADGTPSLILRDREGKRRLGMAVFDDGPDISIFDRDERVIWSIRDVVRITTAADDPTNPVSRYDADSRNRWAEILSTTPSVP